jgi:hypothetical protein
MGFLVHGQPSEAQECLNQIESAVDTGSESFQKKSDEAVLTRHIQLLALKLGKIMSADRIRELF